MALTDSKTGFRLPWATDRSASREAPAEPGEPETDEAGAGEPAAEADATTIATQDATGDADQLDQEGPVTTYAPTTAAPAREPAAAAWAPHEAADVGTAPAALETTRPAPEPARKPTKFLAELTRAMQTAAEQARSATIEQYNADGTAVIEQIHARTATAADELRRRADADVGLIKDWSKAEIARIRDETEQRVAGRREQLEGQLERHAALVEHEIEKVRSRIAGFEAEMGRFFDELLGEEDPARFAARAASLPEPPSFAPLDDDALEAILAEPGQGVPAPAEPQPEPAAEAGGVEPAPVEAAIEPSAGIVAEESVETSAPSDGDTEALDPLDREAAMAAIQAAAETAAAVEAAGEQTDGAAAADDGAEAIVAGAEVVVAEPEVVVAEPVGATEADVPADDTVAPGEPDAAEPGADPRLAMLGLTPDFAAAEAAAAEEAAEAGAEPLPEIEGELLAARLSGLVPDEPREAVPTVTTQVVTTGLVSVASIASFKRHLGRLSGVVHVGVSSGPDGEFVFGVEHDPEISLRDLVPTVPGFGARVVSSGEGVMQVSAQDPQD